MGIIIRVGFLLSVGKTTLQAQPTNSILLLKRRLALATADTSRSRLAWELGNQYQSVHIDSCLHYLHQSLALARQSHDSFATARAMYQLGYVYLYALKDEARVVSWLNQAKAVASRQGDNLHLTRCYQLLTIVAMHQRIGDPFELFALAHQYAQKTGSYVELSDVYALGVELYGWYRKYHQAERYCLQAMAIYRRYNLDRWFTAGLDYCDLLKEQGKTTQALAVAHRLASVRHLLPQTDGVFVYFNDMARLCVYLRQFAQAEAYLLRGLTDEQKRSRPDTIHLSHYYQNLADLYVAKGDYQKAYLASENLAEVRLWLQRTRQTRDVKLQMTQLKAALDLEKKERQISVLQARQQRQWFYLVGTLTATVLLIGFLLMLQRNKQRLERQRAQLAQLNATKDKLFAVLSHDLRSPVASLQNFLLLHDWGMLSKEEFAESTQSLSERLTQVHTMLENVLNWAIGQLGGYRARQVNVRVAPLIEQEIRLLQTVADTKRIDIRCELAAELSLLGDPDHLAIIVRNLLQNALKFTPAGGRIWVRAEPQGVMSCLTIRDTGIGMPTTQLTTLFQMDQSSSQPGTANEPGVGLGLPLVKELVTLNKGIVRVESRENEGTTFFLYFRQTTAAHSQMDKVPFSPATAGE
ncbi:sensor histidine kinase [Spirosoma koreense]